MSIHLPLTRLAPGQTGRIAEIHGGHGVTRRLEGLGVRPGVCVSLLTRFAMGGPVTICVGRSRVALGRGMAGKVLVEIESGDSGATPPHR